MNQSVRSLFLSLLFILETCGVFYWGEVCMCVCVCVGGGGYVCVWWGGGWKGLGTHIATFQFLIPANRGVATFSLQKVPESAGDSGIFALFILLC